MLVDASPLIYLAKIDALDVFASSGHVPLITPEVERETARPGLAYEYPDSLVIADALDSGLLTRTQLTEPEMKLAERLSREAGGIDLGESEVLAAAVARHEPALLFERRATALARSMGVDAWSPARLLFAGTPDSSLLRDRIRGFASLVQMRYEDVQKLIAVTEESDR